MGIRAALGAEKSDLFKLVLGEGARLAAVGAAIGLIAAFLLARTLSKLLFGVKAYDPATFLGVTALLLAVAALASYVPARRATRVDPNVVLRYE
jgi:ABC-type antimicrobial peptide transport system permease subunit